MALSIETLAVAKKYTDDSIAGGGALKGKNCVITSIASITGGHRVTFQWTLDNGTVQTDTMDVMDGADGQDGEDGKGIQSVSVNENNHLIITYSDGTTTDAGQIEIHSAVDSVNGQTGAVTLDAEDVGALPANTPIPSKTSDLTNDSGFITKVVNDLVNYYLKSETYSKTQVDDIITAVKNSRFEVVATLPTTDIKTNVIYLVPKDPTQTSNVKDEYINLNGTTAGWEKIGDTEIDLSDYVTTQALNTALAAYTTTADLTTLLEAKQDTLTFDDAPTENSNNPVKSGGVYSADANIYAEMTRQGVKNILSQQFDEVMITASLGNKATSANGLTLTYNSDGSIKINGTPTDSSKNVAIRFDWDTNNHPFDISYLAGKKVVVSISETEINGIKIIPGYFDASGGAHQYSGADITTKGEYTYPNDTKWARCYLSISGAYSYSNVTVYPMIYIPFEGATDDYAPPTKTNQELTADKAEQAEVNDIVNVLGAKNVLPFPYYAGSGTYNGVTITDNGDGSITLDGTCTGMSFFVFYGGRYSLAPTTFVKKNEDYIATLEVVSGSMAINSGTSKFVFRNYITNATSPFVDIFYEEKVIDTRSVKFTYEPTASYDTSLVWYEFNVGTTFNNWRIRPMIRPASIQDDTYVPYAKTNQQLTEDTTALLDNTEVNGAVNMFDNILASPQVVNGITYTVNDNGSVTCNGTATANGGVMLGGIAVKSGKAYKISGCPSGGDADNSYALIVRATNSTSAAVIGSDIGNGFIYAPTSDTTVYLQIRFANGQTASDLTFKPMITVPSYNGDYVPYAKTNRQLTEDSVDWESNSVLGAKNFLHTNGSQTTRGVLFERDENGVFTVTRQTADSNHAYYNNGRFTLKPGTYIFSNGYDSLPSGIQATYLYNYTDSSYFTNCNNGPKTFTITEEKELAFNIEVQSSQSPNGVKIYPMIRLASDNDATYQPYAMTNQELTKVNTAEVNILIQTSELAQYRVRKCGKIVECTISLQVNEAVTAWTDFATVPEGFRPSTYIQAVNNKTIYTGFAVMQIAPNGGIQSAVNLAVGDRVRFTAVWICP